HLQAADQYGNTTLVTDLTFTLDTTAPMVEVTSQTPTPTNHNVTVSGAVTDALSGVYALTAQLDNGSIASVTLDASSGAFSIPTNLALDGSAAGPHTLHLRGTDVAGNLASVRDVSFTLDTRPPVVPAFDLSSTSVTTGSAAHQTAAARVALVGQTDPNVT